MRGLRQILLEHRRFALWLVALALAMKALVPAGYMVAAQDRVISVSICGDASGTHITREILVPGHEAAAEQSAQHVKAASCPFSALDMAGTPGADPVLLAAALAFIFAIGFAPKAAPALRARAYLRPPLRGPPILT